MDPPGHTRAPQMLGRGVTKEIEVGDALPSPGQAVLFPWPSGSRDEREFAEPDRFDIQRGAPRILSASTCVWARAWRAWRAA